MFRSLLVAAVLAASVVPAAAETQSRVLANGMKVIVREDHRAPVAVTQLWFKVGSADEHAGKTGLSHALEHMMFKGTPTGTGLARGHRCAPRHPARLAGRVARRGG